MKYTNIIIIPCAFLAIYCLIIICAFTLVAYLELGFLPGGSFERGFSIHHFLTYSNNGLWYFYVLKFFQETIIPALIFFHILSVPTLVFLYYKLFFRKEFNFLFISTFIITHFLLIGFFSRRLGIEEWIRCLLCWYFE
jgi:hypothetical protein